MTNQTTPLTLVQNHQVQTSDLNPHHTLYAGKTFLWALEAAYTLAQSQTKDQMVAVGINEFKYLQAVKLGQKVEAHAQVIKFGKTSVTIEVTLLLPDNVKAAMGLITFVNTDPNGQKIEHHRSLN